MRKDSHHSAKCSGNQRMMWECVTQKPDNSEKKDGGLQKSLGKIINKIDNLELKMCKMSISDEKGKEMELKLEKKQMCNLSQVALVNGPSSKAVKKTESAPVSLLKLRAFPPHLK